VLFVYFPYLHPPFSLSSLPFLCLEYFCFLILCHFLRLIYLLLISSFHFVSNFSSCQFHLHLLPSCSISSPHPYHLHATVSPTAAALMALVLWHQLSNIDSRNNRLVTRKKVLKDVAVGGGRSTRSRYDCHRTDNTVDSDSCSQFQRQFCEIRCC
jgi:hypothetical protein